MPRAKSTGEDLVKKWDETDMYWYTYVWSYCEDAKHRYLRQEEYTAVTKRLTTRTGWALRELEGWLATKGFKACAGNGVAPWPGSEIPGFLLYVHSDR